MLCWVSRYKHTFCDLLSHLHHISPSRNLGCMTWKRCGQGFQCWYVFKGGSPAQSDFCSCLQIRSCDYSQMCVISQVTQLQLSLNLIRWSDYFLLQFIEVDNSLNVNNWKIVFGLLIGRCLFASFRLSCRLSIGTTWLSSGSMGPCSSAWPQTSNAKWVIFKDTLSYTVGTHSLRQRNTKSVLMA